MTSRLLLAAGLCAAGLLLAGTPALAQRDGTPGNPPSTATQRATDRATGSAPTPADGTRGNPPGTAVGRATDRTVGTNTTGANPRHGQRTRRARQGATPTR
jgi:hypothetical protein